MRKVVEGRKIKLRFRSICIHNPRDIIEVVVEVTAACMAYTCISISVLNLSSTDTSVPLPEKKRKIVIEISRHTMQHKKILEKHYDQKSFICDAIINISSVFLCHILKNYTDKTNIKSYVKSRSLVK